MSTINTWEVWFASFPFEDSRETKDRPVIVLNVEPLEVLSVKVTSHNVRNRDRFDIPIVKWVEAGLRQPSTARISKTIYLDVNSFKRKIGSLHNDDKTQIMNTYMDYINSI